SSRNNSYLIAQIFLQSFPATDPDLGLCLQTVTGELNNLSGHSSRLRYDYQARSVTGPHLQRTAKDQESTQLAPLAAVGIGKKPCQFLFRALGKTHRSSLPANVGRGRYCRLSPAVPVRFPLHSAIR